MPGLQLLDPYPRGTLGERIGSALGEGINAYTTAKNQSQAAKDLAPMFESQGMDPAQAQQTAKAFSKLDPQVQAQYLRGAQAAQIQGQEAQRKAKTQSFVESIASGRGLQPQEKAAGLGLLGPQQTQRTPEGAEFTPVDYNKMRQAKTQQQAHQAQPKRTSEEARLVSEINNIQDTLSNPETDPADRIALQDAMEKRQTRLDKIEKIREDKFGKEVSKKHEEYLNSKNRLTEYSRLKELNESGELPSTALVAFLDSAGLDIPALLQGSGEEFQKIVQNFTKDAKEYYGGRITNTELEQFMKTVPSLLQSPEGRKRVLANMERLDKMKIATYKAMKHATEDNKGIAPKDLYNQVDKALKKSRDKISEEFKEDLKKEVPKGSSRLAVGAASIGGRALGGAGKLGKAGLGAYSGFKAGSLLGGLAGPTGATAGGALGGILGGLGGLMG